MGSSKWRSWQWLLALLRTVAAKRVVRNQKLLLREHGHLAELRRHQSEERGDVSAATAEATNTLQSGHSPPPFSHPVSALECSQSPDFL